MNTVQKGWFLALLLATAGPAAAQTSLTARPAAIQQLTDCRALVDAASRLACFDAAAAALEAAEAEGDLVVIDRSQAQAVRRQAFGFNLPSLSLFDRGGKVRAETMDSLTAAVREAHLGGNGRWVVELEDGAVWAQLDDESLVRRPAKGSKAEICRAVLGSYLMKLDGQRAIRARRTQ